jgi:hypothetical protein
MPGVFLLRALFTGRSAVGGQENDFLFAVVSFLAMAPCFQTIDQIGRNGFDGIENNRLSDTLLFPTRCDMRFAFHGFGMQDAVVLPENDFNNPAAEKPQQGLRDVFYRFKRYPAFTRR